MARGRNESPTPSLSHRFMNRLRKESKIVNKVSPLDRAEVLKNLEQSFQDYFDGSSPNIYGGNKGVLGVPWTMLEFLQRWIDKTDGQDLSDASFQNYQTYIKPLLPALANMDHLRESEIEHTASQELQGWLFNTALPLILDHLRLPELASEARMMPVYKRGLSKEQIADISLAQYKFIESVRRIRDERREQAQNWNNRWKSSDYANESEAFSAANEEAREGNFGDTFTVAGLGLSRFYSGAYYDTFKEMDTLATSVIMGSLGFGDDLARIDLLMNGRSTLANIDTQLNESFAKCIHRIINSYQVAS